MLLPTLVRRSAPEFNIFDVMHHGTHEKQLSNVFAWLLDAEGTHGLGETFQTIFIEEVNRGLGDRERVPEGRYSVRQEVNTFDRGRVSNIADHVCRGETTQSKEEADIADLVLESETTVLVVENYYISDGHDHCFGCYRDFGAREGKRSQVVMLCQIEYRERLVLIRHVEGGRYDQRTHAHQCVFFSHMRKHFMKGRQMKDDDLIGFIEAMCIAGEAQRLRESSELAAVSFADMLRERALEQFGESRELLRRLKAALRTFCSGVLKAQVNEALAGERITDVSANFMGIYQWTINFRIPGDEGGSEAPLQVKFGPSAWFANEKDDYWKKRIPAADADYSRLFLTRNPTKEIRQSAVTLQEVLDGIGPDDRRLRDEIVTLIRESA
jgi:hypothetical protein